MTASFEVGQSAEISRQLTTDEVAHYCNLSGHQVEPDQVPEPLIDALFSYLLGVKLPGVGTAYLKQDSQFHQSARVGQTLTARVEIARYRAEKNLVDLTTTCHDDNGDLVCDGRALVWVGDVIKAQRDAQNV